MHAVSGWSRFWVLAIVLTMAGSLYAREVELHLRDGRVIKGALVGETPDRVIVDVAGIRTPFDRSAIEKQTVRLTLVEQFEQDLAKVKPGDASGKFELAYKFRQLASQAAGAGKTDEAKTIYGLVLKQLNEILKINPKHSQAQLLRTLVVDELKKFNQAPAPAPDAPDAPDKPEPDAPQPDAPEPDSPAKPGDVTLLTERDINIIKVFEVKLANQPRVVIADKVLKEVLEKFRDDPVMQPFLDRNGLQKMRRLKGHEQLELLFRLRARDYYGDAVIRGDPEALQKYRQHVYPRYVVPYFMRYFGGGQVEGFQLIRERAVHEKVAYTNYLILHRAEINRVPMIDRFLPMESLLIQWGLPRDEAKYPAPADLKGWRPYFTSREDPRIKPIVEWIQGLWGEKDDYPIEYTPPVPVKADDAAEADEPVAR